MSIELMTRAWKANLPSTQKLVLLALCDNANDAGTCYPSVKNLAEKCGLSARGIQAAFAALEESGYVTRDLRKGRSTVYTIQFPEPKSKLETTDEPPHVVHPRKSCTPARRAPTPAADAPLPPHVVHPTPARRAPITVIEPSNKPSPNHQAQKAPVVVEIPDWMPVTDWEAFLESRKFSRAPMSAQAQIRAIAMLGKLREAGDDPSAVLEQSIINGWKGLFPLRKERGGQSATRDEDWWSGIQ